MPIAIMCPSLGICTTVCCGMLTRGFVNCERAFQSRGCRIPSFVTWWLQQRVTTGGVASTKPLINPSMGGIKHNNNNKIMDSSSPPPPTSETGAESPAAVTWNSRHNQISHIKQYEDFYEDIKHPETDGAETTAGHTTANTTHNSSHELSQEDAATFASSTGFSLPSASINHGLDAIRDSLHGELLGRESHQALLNECYDRILSPQATMTPTSTTTDDDKDQVTSSSFHMMNTTRKISFEIVLITGSAGVGKSSLARSIIPRACQMDGCHFLTGKCEPSARPEPFAPFIAAFTRHFSEITKSGNSKIKKRVLQALEQATQEASGTTGDATGRGVLFNMIPALRSFWNEDTATTPPDHIPSLFQAEAHPTANTGKWTTPRVDSPTISLFCRFLKAYCSAEHKIILLIDDWQWIDASSLKLIEKMSILPDLQGFMLMGTCRGDQVDKQASLSATLRSLEHRGVRITDIAVGPLSLETVTSFVSNLVTTAAAETNQESALAITTSSETVTMLAKLAHERTLGNPFLVLEFFRTLVDRQLLQQNDGSWKWEESKLQAKDAAALGSIQMLDETIQQMASSSSVIREFLKIASCLGSEFDISHVQRVAGLARVDAKAALSTLYKRGVLAPTLDKSRRKTTFAHDRWRDAAHALIPPVAKDGYLLWVGCQLLAQLSVDELLDNIFLVAQLLYPKATSIEDYEDRKHAAEVFGLAGTKAAQCSAFDVAASYFSKAISLLPSTKWEQATSSLCLQLYNFSAEIECCLGNADKVDRLVEEILANTTNLQDQLRAYETKIHSLSARHEFQASVELGFQVLDLLGEPMPKRQWGGLRDLGDLLTLFRIVRNVKEEQVLQLRRLKNWKKMAALKIMHFLGPPLIQCKPEAMLHFTIKGLRITLKHGLSPLASIQFLSLGMLLCNPLLMIEEGFRFEKIGYRIYNEFSSKDLMCRVHLIRYAHILPWREPVRNCIPKTIAGARAGMLSGDVEMAGMNYAHAVVNKLLSGYPIQEVFVEATQFHEQFSKLGQASIVFYFQSSIQLMQNLLGLADNPGILSGDDFDAIKSIQEASAKNYSACHCWLLMAQQFLALLLGDFGSAVDRARELDKQDRTAFGGFLCQYVEFLWALSEAMRARQSHGNHKNRRLAIKALNRLKKITDYPRPERGWSNKILMVEAELFAHKGEKEEALVKWLASIRDAERQGLVHEQALAHERVAKSLMAWGQETQALQHFREARSLYQGWGCVLKSDQMRRVVGEKSAALQLR